MVGTGVASSLMCTPKEALTVAGTSGLAVAGIFLIGRRIKSLRCVCGNTATKSGNAPIACDLTVFSLSERLKHIVLAKSLVQRTKQIIEHHDGFTLVFEQSPLLETQVANWIGKEKRCCPFFSFELSKTETPPLLNLKITGPDGAKEILRSGLKKI
jgi:hypothetical protein